MFFHFRMYLPDQETRKEEEKLFTNVPRAESPEKWQWKVKDGLQIPELDKGGVEIDFQFEAVDIKEVVSLLMGIIKENYVVVDELVGDVDVEIKGKFKRDEVVRMVRTILNSKNFDLKKNGIIYGIYNRENLQDVNTVLNTDIDKNVYLYHLQYANSENLRQLLNDIFPDIAVTHNTNTNVLVIKSSVDEYKQVDAVIQKFDKRPKQVLVEFTIMEVTLSNALKYGVEYFFKNNDKRGGNISLLADGVDSGSGSVIGKGLKAFAFRNDLNTFITILRSEDIEYRDVGVILSLAVEPQDSQG